MHMCVCVWIRASLWPLTPDPRSTEVQGGAAGSLHPDVPRLSWGAADTRRRACRGQHRQPGEEKLVSVSEYGLLFQHFNFPGPLSLTKEMKRVDYKTSTRQFSFEPQFLGGFLWWSGNLICHHTWLNFTVTGWLKQPFDSVLCEEWHTGLHSTAHHQRVLLVTLVWHLWARSPRSQHFYTDTSLSAYGDVASGMTFLTNPVTHRRSEALSSQVLSVIKNPATESWDQVFLCLLPICSERVDRERCTCVLCYFCHCGGRSSTVSFFFFYQRKSCFIPLMM